MRRHHLFEEERLAELLARLRRAPVGWVTAAQELPRTRAAIDDILARAEQDADFRAQLVEDLEAVLAREGVMPERRILDALRSRLG